METVKYKEKDGTQVKAISLAVLYHNINMLEIQYPGKPEMVIAELKANVMNDLGLIKIKGAESGKKAAK